MPPAGGEPETLQPLRQGRLRFAQFSSNRLGELPAVQQRPGSPAKRPAGALETRRRPPPFSKSKAAGRGLLPRAASLIRAGAGRAWPCAPCRPPADSSRQVSARHSRTQQFLSGGGRRPVGGATGPNFAAFHWNWWNPAKAPRSALAGAAKGLVASACSRRWRAGLGRC